MPTPAQDRVRRGPLAALLILLSLLLGSGASAAGNDLHEPLARLRPSRSATANAILASATRNPLDDEATDVEGGPAVPPCGPAVVTRLLWARPLAGAPRGDRVATPRRAAACYRARAPPAA